LTQSLKGLSQQHLERLFSNLKTYMFNKNPSRKTLVCGDFISQIILKMRPDEREKFFKREFKAFLDISELLETIGDYSIQVQVLAKSILVRLEYNLFNI